MKRLHCVALALCALVALPACQTLTTPFTAGRPDYSTLPEAEMRQVAAAIEQMVAAGDREASLPSVAGVVLDTESIHHAVRTRAARVHLVEELRASGVAWERRDGMLHMRSVPGYRQATTRRERDRNALVSYSENQNRWELYEGIVRANNLRPRALDAVKAIFAEARFELLGPGEFYEGPDGDVWVRQ